MLNRRLFNITNATIQDYAEIYEFFTSPNISHFGQRRKPASLRDIFFMQYVTHRILIRLTTTKKIVGYAEVSNRAALPALPPDLWSDFVDFHYCCKLPLKPTNTIFFNSFCYIDSHNPVMLKQLLSEIFHRDSKLKFIVSFESPDYVLNDEKKRQNYYCLRTYSMVLYPKCFSAISCPNTQKMHIIQRDQLLTEMRYRKALPEDNDDIVEIVNLDHPDLKIVLGDFYIAEELLRASSSLLIVTEINHTTAGFLWLNDNVNLLALLKNYVLEPFGNLLKFDAKKRFKEKIIEITSVHRTPLRELFSGEYLTKIFMHVLGSVHNVEDFSNLSLPSNTVLCSSGQISIENERLLVKDFVRRKLEELHNQINSYDHYFQIRRRRYGFYYNVPDNETHCDIEEFLNVFVIRLFGLKDNIDPRRIFSFLSTAFAAYPEKDYCVLSVKLAEEMSLSLLEILKFFIHVSPRPSQSIDENLFITHRSAIFGETSLFAIRPNDVEAITELLEGKRYQPKPKPVKLIRSRISTIADRRTLTERQSIHTAHFEETMESNDHDMKKILEILDEIFNDPFTLYKGYTIRCGDLLRPVDENTIVGFVIVKPFYYNSCLKKNYHITKEKDIHKFAMAELVALKLHPFFHFQSDTIFHELARLTSFNHFYYFMPTNRHATVNDLVATMQPLEPRRIKKLWFEASYQSRSDAYKNSKWFLPNENNEFALSPTCAHLAVFQANLRPTNYFGNCTNIVIIGFSDICKAFLRLMIFSWHDLSDDTQATINCLPHLNITVICKPGVMEAEIEHSFKCPFCSETQQDSCWINYGNADSFIRDVSERMNVHTWIQFVSGSIYEIDVYNHFVKMTTNCDIYYDVLLLMCGTNYGIPDRIFSDVETPANYCHINNRFDKLVFFYKLNTILKGYKDIDNKSIIVYGTHISAHEFIYFLLNHGVKASEIFLFTPYKAEMNFMLNNSSEDTRIEEITREMLEDLGVTIYDQMNWRTYRLHEEYGTIKDVTFVKYITGEEKTIECDLFVSFIELYIEDEMIDVLNAAYLETELNYVLVDQNYQTSRSNIFAMGNFIKHREEPNHQYRFVSPQEAAEKIISILDLINTGDTKPPPMEQRFSKPYFFRAQLPMNYYFIKITCPKRYLANHLDNQYGFPLTTYDDGDFCRVRLNEHGIVEEIVIVTQKKMSCDFLKFFCGRHELLLNNLKSRWFLKNITNFLEFFQEPWVELIMHDRFEDLRRINKALISKTAEEIMKQDVNRENRLKLMNNHCRELGITGQLEYAL